MHTDRSFSRRQSSLKRLLSFVVPFARLLPVALSHPSPSAPLSGHLTLFQLAPSRFQLHFSVLPPLNYCNQSDCWSCIRICANRSWPLLWRRWIGSLGSSEPNQSKPAAAAVARAVVLSDSSSEACLQMHSTHIQASRLPEPAGHCTAL